MDMTLVGLTEIAQRAGVQKAAVSMWISRHDDFPQPYARLATGSIWLWTPVKVWLDRTGRKSDCELSREEVNRYEKRTISTITTRKRASQ